MPLISIDSRKHLFMKNMDRNPYHFYPPAGHGTQGFLLSAPSIQAFQGDFSRFKQYGDSDHIDQPASISYYANEIAQFMDALHIDKAVLFGYLPEA